MGHALYYPRQNIRSHCQPANNATPRSRVLFSIIIRQVCIKLANWRNLRTLDQFFFFSKSIPGSQLSNQENNFFPCPSSTLLSVHNRFQVKVKGRLNGKKKKRIGGIAICPNKLGEVFLIDPILLGRALARAKPLSSPSS